MRNRKRLTHMLIAGTMTVLLATVVLAFRGGDADTAEAATTDQTVAVEIVGDYEADIAALQGQIEALQAQNTAYADQNAQLLAAVEALQAREAEYQAQIEAANQTINELSTQASVAQGPALGGERPGHTHDH